MNIVKIKKVSGETIPDIGGREYIRCSVESVPRINDEIRVWLRVNGSSTMMMFRVEKVIHEIDFYPERDDVGFNGSSANDIELRVIQI